MFRTFTEFIPNKEQGGSDRSGARKNFLEKTLQRWKELKRIKPGSAKTLEGGKKYIFDSQNDKPNRITTRIGKCK